MKQVFIPSNGVGNEAYDLFVQGYSYGDIAALLSSDIFTVMEQVAHASQIFAEQRLQNPQAEQEFIYAQLRRVIKLAQERIDSPEEWGNELQVILGATKQLTSLALNPSKLATRKAPAQQTSLPGGVSAEDARGAAHNAVRSKFKSLEGGRREA